MVLVMVNLINEKGKAIVLQISLIIALSKVEILITISINNYLKSYFNNIDLYIAMVPILFILVIEWIHSKNVIQDPLISRFSMRCEFIHLSNEDKQNCVKYRTEQ